MEMGMFLNRFFNSFIFWAAWIAIPMVMEILPSLGSFFILLKRRREYDKKDKPTIYPEISIIVPVYNSAETLEACLRSINDSTYPNKSIRIFLVNNLSRDNSFEVYTRCQDLFPELHMQWLNAQQGKSRALNLALYNSEGKYIVHIDSDGLLEPHALTNLVELFESDLSCNCVTGSILTDPEKVEEYKGPGLLLRRLEFMEYAQAFLAGRNYASETNTIYTLSGAFSAFRKSAILKSWLYNTDTICEDTQLTFQMRYLQGEKVRTSVDSIFLTDPIEDLDKLYTQRQRWQRGSLEVSKMFMDTDKLTPRKLFTDINVRTLMYDHTFAFPRMIWYLATICMIFLGFSGTTILMATGVLFGLYTVCGYLYFFAGLSFLRQFPDLRKYYRKNWWLVPLLPFFNLMVFFIRMAGIVNSIGTDSTWKTRTFTDERSDFAAAVRQDFSKLARGLDKLRAAVNGDEATMYLPKTVDQRLKGSVLGYLAVALAYVAAVVILVVVHWASHSFHITLAEIFNTLFGSLKGAGGGTVGNALWACLPPILAALIVAGVALWFDRRNTKQVLSAPEGPYRQERSRSILRRRKAGVCFTCLLLAGSLIYANACYNLTGFLASKFTYSSLYEDSYVDPRSVSITTSQKPKNLIYIYMESMETTYASPDVGGVQETNLIPNLTRLAQANVSFSSTDSPLGGFYSNVGATWTMAALFSTSSGVHFALPVSESAVEKMGAYASGLTTLGDILKEAGYRNEFLCGSDFDFANRADFFRQHGDYEIFDYYTAIERGYLDEDYYEWWGFEDAKLYEYAKVELQRLSQSDRPFNLTLLTADTHYPEGYLCPLCGNDHAERAANVVACADAQVGAFVAWCQAQDFYDDTVIVITGDHPRMDTVLVGETPWEQRGVYNCFINAVTDGPVRARNRQCNALDIFPTTLSALGFDIRGDRLGLGTDLFATRRTLSESMGPAALDEELSVQSGFYINHFAPELAVLGSAQDKDPQVQAERRTA